LLNMPAEGEGSWCVCWMLFGWCCRCLSRLPACRPGGAASSCFSTAFLQILFYNSCSVTAFLQLLSCRELQYRPAA
jgi:hypothetical protein